MSTLGLSSENFWQRWGHHERPLRKLAQRLLGAHSCDVEDAVANTLVRAMHALRSSSARVHNERSWLARILHNVCMDMHRHQERFVEPSLSGHSEGTDVPYESPLEVADSPEEALLGREQAEVLRAHIRALPSTLRIPLVMRFYEDMSYREISSALDLTSCNVRKRVQFANDRLRVSLEARPPRRSSMRRGGLRIPGGGRDARSG